MEFAMRIPEPLRRKYIERRARDADELASALERGDFEVLSRLGHQLKGNAATYGYETLSVLGHKMDHAAQTQSLAEGKECLYALRAWLQEQTNTAGEDG
jgi:HPt (histidine-containing phosphotransfer) domain-containing protein